MAENSQPTDYAFYIAALIYRHREQQPLSAQELQELETWRRSDPAHEQLWDSLHDRPLLVQELKGLQDERYARAIEGVFHQLQQIPHPAPIAPIRSPSGRWWMAAAVLLLLAIGAWLFTVHRPAALPEGPSRSYYANDVPPGGNKAVLTLGNGAHVVLDTARDGQLLKQGDADIVKQKDGMLIYTPADGAPAMPVYNVLTTPRGGQYSLRLPDGTLVWLDAASSIRYPTAFTGRERRVDITGQAYFEVAPDAKAPFSVYKDNIHVEVLGTRFNINAYEEEGAARVTLLDGSVRVGNGRQTMLVAPGQQVKMETGSLQPVADVDVEEVMAWKNGLFKFNNADVATILRQAARWYDIDVSYQGAPPAERFRGKLSRNSKLSGFLKILELNNVHFLIEGKKVTILQTHP